MAIKARGMSRVPPSAPGLLPCNNIPYVCIRCCSFRAHAQDRRPSLPQSPLFRAPCFWPNAMDRGSYRVFRTGRLTRNRLQTGMASKVFRSLRPPEENRHFPKLDRMPDAPHGVKVETQVVDGVQDLSQDFVGRI